MPHLSDVEFGPDDAITRDRNFSKKWIEPPEIKICLSDDNWLVSGEKGSGKSAINRAIRELYGSKYNYTSVVKFDNFTFQSIYQNITAISRTVQADVSSVMSKYWQFALILEMIEQCARENPDIYGGLFSDCRNLDSSEGVSKRLTRHIEKMWKILDNITNKGVSKSDSKTVRGLGLIETSGLTAEELHEYTSYPVTKQFLNLKEKFFKKLEENSESAILILDGLDKLDNTHVTASSLNLIFASLIDATVSIRNDELLPPGFQLKIIIPHDRYLSINLRDSDKIDSMHAQIIWNKTTLAEFVRKRIEVSLGQNNSFQNLWRSVMPDTVLNKYHGINEDSFDYILRHTMYRPRHIQAYLKEISKRYPAVNIESNMIPACVVDVANDITRHFCNEHRQDHQHLLRFLQLFDRKDNIMTYSIFRDRVLFALNKFHSNPDVRPLVDDKIDSLYMMGVFGIVKFLEPGEPVGDRYLPPTKESKRHYVDFFYKNRQHSVSGILADDSLIALHSVFIDSVNLRAHPSMIVG